MGITLRSVSAFVPSVHRLATPSLGLGGRARLQAAPTVRHTARSLPSGWGAPGRARLFHATSMKAADAAAAPAKGKKKPGKAKEDSKYSKTVNLPETNFNQRANAVKREPELQAFWKDQKVYEQAYEDSTGSKFVLHDGPPYANGDLHIGHALNKILKDFINRYQILKGSKVRFVPGWDCHGLPIELKVLQSMKSAEKRELTPVKLRKKAAAFARETVDKQMDSFKRYGVWGDWERPYLTLLPEYEAAQIKVFGEMVEGGHIYRGRKPVNWSPSSRTALAEAELEYPEGHTSRSLWASFPVTQKSDALGKEFGDQDIRVAVWTTTPWTLPANLAVAVNERLDYALVRAPSGESYIVAKDLVGNLAIKMQGEAEEEGGGRPPPPVLEELAVFKGKDLEGTVYKHPLYERESKVVIGGEYITTESGTGLVHTAPGHGVEDYQTGLKYGLELLSPVDDGGLFTEEAGEDLKGKSVLGDGNQAVIDMMREAGALIKEEPYGHKYPYDWRTKKPTIFRATDQWFASVDSFRDTAMEEIEKVKFIPEKGRSRIQSMVEGRSDWCISRQRNWGVPIPVFYHKETGDPLLTRESIEHVRKIVADKGTDAWFEMGEEELLPPSHQAEADQWVKGKDTMDVWFDSGSSWAGVVQERGEELAYPADMYLEGSDQHRGWFQSSLLTSVAAQGKAPYKTVLTHGFVLDEKGFKMSKSLGNVVDPRQIIEGGKNQKLQPPYGADVLRLWVSSVDYTGDVRVGANIMKQISDSYRKIRNTLRYLLGNLNDFDPEQHSVPYDDMPSVDKWMLGKLAEVQGEVRDAFEKHQFYRASQSITQLVIGDLSNLYLDVAKDRLYISSPDDLSRRSCQTVLKVALEMLTTAIAPLMPHMAEDAWLNIPWKVEKQSVFQHGWQALDYEQHEADKWATVREVRDDVNLAMEKARRGGVVGANMEAKVVIHCGDNEELKDLIAGSMQQDSILAYPSPVTVADDIRFILLASQVKIVDSADAVVDACGQDYTVGTDGKTESGIVVGVTKAEGKKCERCWFYDESVGEHEGQDGVCPRCGHAAAEFFKK